MPRRLFRAALVISPALAVLGAAGIAHADPFFPDPKTSVVVTRLTITDGKGWLVLQPRIGHDTAIGFEVRIPAGDGVWSGAPSIVVPDMGIACVRQPGPGLDYLCGSDDAYADPEPMLLPSGGYQISLPVTRTGPVSGLVGATTFWEINPSYGAVSYASDTFPVVDGTSFRSTAEVRSLYTGIGGPVGSSDRGDIALTMTVVPGEDVHSVDIQLPPADWRLLAYQLRPAISCRLSGGPTAPILHCAPTNPSRTFPVGRYPFVLKVDVPATEDDSIGQDATVALTVGSATPAIQDTFGWYTAFAY